MKNRELAFYNGNIKSTFIYQLSLLAASMSMKDGRENRERRALFLKPFHPNIGAFHCHTIIKPFNK